LQDIEQIEKFTLIVAFVWYYKTEMLMHENLEKLQLKKHRGKAKSIYKIWACAK